MIYNPVSQITFIECPDCGSQFGFIDNLRAPRVYCTNCQTVLLLMQDDEVVSLRIKENVDGIV